MKLRICLALLLAVVPTFAAVMRGKVTFNGLPVPGASVTATMGDRRLQTVTDGEGGYTLDLEDGWIIEVSMLGFASAKQAAAPDQTWELKMLPMSEIKAEVLHDAPPPVEATKPITSAPKPAARPAAQPPKQQALVQRDQAPPPPADSAEAKATDGLLINGSVNNGASTPFAQFQGFGNTRAGIRSQYQGSLGLTLDNSAFDATNYSLTGQNTAKPGYNRMTGLFALGGPFRIPHLVRNGPNFNLNYQWTRNRNSSVGTGLMPTADQRAQVPVSQISPQALQLLQLYPMPNFTGSSRYNFQVPLVSNQHTDSLQARSNKLVKRKYAISGQFGYQNARGDSNSILNFLDTTATQGLRAQAGLRYSFNARRFLNMGFTYSRMGSVSTPYFANRVNVSGLAGITGNDTDPRNWGPPSLSFSSGIQPLTDGNYSAQHNESYAWNADSFWNRGRHNITYGGDFTRQIQNSIGQQNPRGSFGFVGATDFADFLRGVPDTSSIALGNADKYFRANIADAYIRDDWRTRPGLTLDLGARWDYLSPVSEKYGRLVNLVPTAGFGSATTLISADGGLSKKLANVSPRIGLAWRPFSASSLLVRAGYTLSYDTSVYGPIANQMAQQAPLSKSLRISNSPATPLTLANGFLGTAAAATFGVDPNFKIGYAQNWNASLQRDLPWAMQMTAGYVGTKGTHAIQQILPNTYPTGGVDPCPTCLSGYTYYLSGGNSTRHAGSVTLRRRMRSGFTAETTYTYAKAIDNAGVGGIAFTAQNWLDLRSEKALSSFDQRHVLSFTTQYTTGLGAKGGTLMSGKTGALFKDWTFGTQINAATGRPETASYPAPTAGTGLIGAMRADYTGAPLYDAPAGFAINPAAFAAPASGHWGNSGRDIITGPTQFGMNSNMSRTFRMSDRYSLDVQINASNVLNHVNYTSWVTTVGSAQFGLPASAGQMRLVQSTFRFRF